MGGWAAGRLFEVFDGARGVAAHVDVGLVSVWFGSSTVYVYCAYTGVLVRDWTKYGMKAPEFRAAAIEHVKQEEKTK